MSHPPHLQVPSQHPLHPYVPGVRETGVGNVLGTVEGTRCKAELGAELVTAWGGEMSGGGVVIEEVELEASVEFCTRIDCYNEPITMPQLFLFTKMASSMLSS